MMRKGIEIKTKIEMDDPLSEATERDRKAAERVRWWGRDEREQVQNKKSTFQKKRVCGMLKVWNKENNWSIMTLYNIARCMEFFLHYQPIVYELHYAHIISTIILCTLLFARFFFSFTPLLGFMR